MTDCCNDYDNDVNEDDNGGSNNDGELMMSVIVVVMLVMMITVDNKFHSDNEENSLIWN